MSSHKLEVEITQPWIEISLKFGVQRDLDILKRVTSVSEIEAGSRFRTLWPPS